MSKSFHWKSGEITVSFSITAFLVKLDIYVLFFPLKNNAYISLFPMELTLFIWTVVTFLMNLTREESVLFTNKQGLRRVNFHVLTKNACLRCFE